MDRAPQTNEAIHAHDLQRRLSPEAERALVEALLDRLPGAGLCLDAGIGSGRSALPLARAGVRMVGVDRSRDMLGACRANVGRDAAVPLVQADLIRLPFRDGAFGAALAANVFHLIAAWRAAVAELVRVVQPGGLLLVNLGARDTSEIARRVRIEFEARLGDRHVMEGAEVGPRSPDEFSAYFAAYGVTELAPVRVRDVRTRTIEQMIARLEHNPFAWPDGVDAAAGAAAAATRSWAADHFGPLNRPYPVARRISYRVYRTASALRA